MNLVASDTKADPQDELADFSNFLGPVPQADAASASSGLTCETDGPALVAGTSRHPLPSGAETRHAGDAAEAYADACRLFDARDFGPALSAFTTAMCHDPAMAEASAYGLLLCLAGLDRHEELLTLARFLEEAGLTHPGIPALAGHATFRLGNAREGRLALARAARGARGKPEYRPVQQFAQRTLLMQHFNS
ncbi:hypothetical protein [Pseudooceanicola aestuarii]|uniref:hypothetical protein n=1 Tax=Pseudooceanicola aestuarii TaxID=2697319 RepID=UPI0013D277F0|nr:hypothetical protein [Pseudooceanicola aestuarii]